MPPKQEQKPQAIVSKLEISLSTDIYEASGRTAKRYFPATRFLESIIRIHGDIPNFTPEYIKALIKFHKDFFSQYDVILDEGDIGNE